MAMRRLKLNFTETLLDVFKDNPELMVANPLGMVPTLLTPEHGAIADSSMILEYLHEKTGSIWPKDFASRIENRKASALAEGIIQSSVLYFQETKMHDVPSSLWVSEHVSSMERTLEFLSKMPNSVWVQNGELTQAGWDLAVGIEYVQFRVPEIVWKEKCPSLISVVELANRNLDFVETQPKA